MKPKTTPIDSTNSSLAGFPLLYAFIRLWQRCRPAFAQERTHRLGLEVALGLLSAFGRRTISRGICARALQHFDWSPFYRFFSKDVWYPVVLTHQLLIEIGRHLQAGMPLVIGIDDTTKAKTGKKIPSSGYFYNSKSPAFARSFKWALRFIIIAPLHYRLSKNSKLLYRRPAYLLVTECDYPIHLAIQHYFHRWEIEVNHRDAKESFGVGDAQVRAPRSVSRQFSFAALIYSLLVLAGINAYGPSRTTNYTPRPKWRNDPRSRPSALDLATQLRLELWRHESGGHIIEFPVDPVLSPNHPKYIESAIDWLAQTVPKGLSLRAWSAILHADA